MKIALITFIFLLTITCNLFGQLSHVQKFESDYRMVGAVYEKNLVPYLNKFVDLLYPKKDSSILYQGLKDSRYKNYFQKAVHIREECLKILLKDSTSIKSMDKLDLVLYYATVYQVEFTGLDSKFYDKTKQDVISIQEGKIK